MDFTRIREAVCALGFPRISMEEHRADPSKHAFEIIGTGFRTGERVVMTCAHVLDEISKILKTKPRLPHRLAVAQFVYPLEGTQWRVALRRVDVFQRDDRFDLAASVAFDPDDMKPIMKLPVVKGDYAPTIGEEVAICGYAHGSVLVQEGGRVHRFGPIVQRGYIAALSPFDGPSPTSVLLDLTAGPAASGSPVVRLATGEVIGVLVRGQIGKVAPISVATLIHDDGTSIIARRSAITAI